jgi:hypothetical protein
LVFGLWSLVFGVIAFVIGTPNKNWIVFYVGLKKCIAIRSLLHFYCSFPYFLLLEQKKVAKKIQVFTP